MTWLTLLKALLTAVGALVSFLKERQLVEGARAELIATNLRAALDEAAKANTVREAVRAELERNPASLRDDDGFKRPD